MTPELRVAFVGAGQMARLHFNALRRVSTPHQVVGICDINAGAAQELARRAGGRPFDSIDTMLAETRPNVVHVLTPAGAHYMPARAALTSGAHVYVEKPFVETANEAETLLALADANGLAVCAGHQLIREPAFEDLMRATERLGRVIHIDSQFCFRSPTLRLHEAGPTMKAAQLLDILPHPLYSLVAAIEVAAGQMGQVDVESLYTSATEIDVCFHAEHVRARLQVSLEARPVASTLTIRGTEGAYTADLMRGMVTGAGNPGTGPLEKILNPLREAWQMQIRSTKSLVRRVLHAGDYPGLAELMGDFYAAIHQGRRDEPLSPAHLRNVSELYERIATAVHQDVAREKAQLPGPPARSSNSPLAVVTGASGFLGRAVTRELGGRGFRVRGIARRIDTDHPHVHEWRAFDLSRPIPGDAIEGADVVVHTAAATAGGFEAHQASTVQATAHLLQAMDAANVRRLVYVSSISVLRVPKTPWEIQNEHTPLAKGAEKLGPYTWGKCEAEKLLAVEAPRLNISTKIVRPGALIDWGAPEAPGLLGRRLYGRWHLGLGRPGLPLAVYDVTGAGRVLAWMADNFDAAPDLLNLNDQALATRKAFIAALRAGGWEGRFVWVPISCIALLFGVARWTLALARGRRPTRMAVWSILRPRRYDMSLAATVAAASTTALPDAAAVVSTPHHTAKFEVGHR